jgi:hypothetical protein
MTSATLHAIEQVVLVNRDIIELCEKRGVKATDLQAVFKLAHIGQETVALSEAIITEVIAEELAGIPTTEAEVALEEERQREERKT